MKHKYLAILLSIFLFQNPLNAQVNRYVDFSNGVNTGTGISISSPFKTLSYAITNSSAGDTLNLRGGSYYETSPSIINKSIYIRNYNGEKPIIDGFNFNIDSSRPALIKIGSGASNAILNNVVIDGITIQNFYSFQAKMIWVVNDINNQGSINNVVIKNCTFSKIRWWFNATLDKLTIDSTCHVSIIKVDGQRTNGIKNVVITNNIFSNCSLGWGEAILVTNNVDSFWIEGNNINHISGSGIHCKGFSHDTFPNIPNRQVRNGFIRKNIIYRCASPSRIASGVFLNGIRNCIVEQNSISNSTIGITVGIERPTPTNTISSNQIIRNNKIYENVISGIKLGTNLQNSYVRNSKIINNTLLFNCTGEAENGVGIINGIPLSTILKSKKEIELEGSDSSHFQNNILYCLKKTLSFEGDSGVESKNLYLSNNLYYRLDSFENYYFPISHKINGIIPTNNGTYFSINDFNKLKLDSFSISGHPKFRFLTNDDFSLDSCSIAIDKGAISLGNSTYGMTDYIGATRVFNVKIDIGAYEYQGLNPPCGFSIDSAFSFCDNEKTKIKLKWGRSLNADSFIIYRNDTVVKSIDTSVYSFTDSNFLIAKKDYTYKIESKNKDGVKISTKIINAKECSKSSIHNAVTTDNILIYPNPLTEMGDKVYIKSDKYIHPERIQVLNLLGQRVGNLTISSENNVLTIDFKNSYLEVGFYTILLEYDQYIRSYKLSIQR